jgi:NitT/TauT family transport system substrate-binding protein
MTMSKFRIDRRAALGLIGGAGASVLVPMSGRGVNAQMLDKVTLLLSVLWELQALLDQTVRLVLKDHLD